MNPDSTTGLILSDGRILEATFVNKASITKNGIVLKKEYTGCIITHADGQKVWFSNSWFSHIKPKRPGRKDVFL
jgi:hypothetical protein